MSVPNDIRYAFTVEWYDQAASLVRPYLLNYFTKDNTIEMYDIRNKRTFLKRSEYPSLVLKDIFLGAVITVHSRKLKVVEYADEFTKSQLSNQKAKTLALIKPDSYLKIGQIISIAQANGFTVANMKMVRLSKQQAEAFYSEHRQLPHFNQLTDFMSSDLAVAIELIADNCVSRWLEVLGPTDPSVAKREKPNSIRAQFGSNALMNTAHGSANQQAAAKQIQFFFSRKPSLASPACFNNCACLVVKPHAVSSGNAGKIIDTVLRSGFEISAMELFWLDRPSAEEFLEVYKNVVPQFSRMVDELINGGSIAMEIRQDDPVTKLRELCGPHDPQMAKAVRPKTLRAQFGEDKARNAVHCTDLPEDGVLEVEYFFNILQK